MVTCPICNGKRPPPYPRLAPGHEVRRIEVVKLELVISCDRSEPVLVTSCVTIR